jgi:hypothetical protein
LGEGSAKMTTMKFILLSIVFTAIAARADLVMQYQSILSGETNIMVTKIHGDKTRVDNSTANEDLPIIKDASNGDMFILWPKKEKFAKYSGAKEKKWIEDRNKQSGNPNAINRKLLDTGKSDQVNGYDTEIYSWSDGDTTVTYWLAKDFPNYQRIKIYLATFDKASFAGMGRDTLFELSKLPGMMVKAQSVNKNFTHTTTLISVKEEPVDASFFEIPKDYKEEDPAINK